MSFISKLFSGDFNFILPVSYIIMAVIVAALVFIVRYSVFMKRKRHFERLQAVGNGRNSAEKEGQ